MLIEQEIIPRDIGEKILKARMNLKRKVSAL
jgi:hypothetical protein